MEKKLVITTRYPNDVIEDIERELEIGQEIVGATERFGDNRQVVIDLGDFETVTHEQMIFLARSIYVYFWEVVNADEAPVIEQPEPIRDWAARTFACSKNVAIRPARVAEGVR